MYGSAARTGNANYSRRLRDQLFAHRAAQIPRLAGSLASRCALPLKARSTACKHARYNKRIVQLEPSFPQVFRSLSFPSKEPIQSPLTSEYKNSRD